MRKLLSSKWTKVVVFLLCLTPLGALGWRAFHGGLGANPVEFVQHATGDWILRFLVITLAITPLRKLLNLPDLIRFRRMLGLFAFFYACLHFLTYIGPDKSFDLSAMWKDVAKRRYITVGFAAFVLLIPLAITSTKGWIRRLGGKRWQQLHRAIYAAAVLGVRAGTGRRQPGRRDGRRAAADRLRAEGNRADHPLPGAVIGRPVRTLRLRT